MSNKMTVKDRLKTYRKHPGSFLVMLLVMLGALLTFSVLLFLIAYILINGVPHIKLSLFEWNYTSENASVVPALINTIVMTILSLLIAVPFGIFSAIFLVEYSGKGNKFVEVIRLTTETLSGIPSIVYGLFGMLFFVNTLDWGFSILAGQLFLILCVQSVLEAMASKWQSGFMQKPIELGCYIASLAVVLRFMETYLLDILRALTHFF